MSSIAGLLDLARSTLLADQTALSATANNVANQNTPGYTAERVNWSAGDTVTLTGQGGQAESSPAAPNIATQSLRDRVLEQRVQQGTQSQAESSTRASVLSSIEGVFSLGGAKNTGSTQLGTTLDALFASFASFASSPGSVPARQAVIAAAGAVVSAFNAAANGLTQISNGINGELSNSASLVNGLTANIASLNARIGALSPNSDAGGLEDQRQGAIAQLSQYVGLNQVRTESNGITLTTTSGILLVAGDQSFALHTSVVGANTVVTGTGGTGQTLTGGSIGGSLLAQTQDIVAVSTALDALAFRVGNAINNANQAGITMTGSGGTLIFSLPATVTGAAGAMGMNSTNPVVLAAAAVGEGATGNTNANLLAGLNQLPDGSGATVSDQLAAMLGSVGGLSAALKTQTDVQTASLTQLTTQRDSISGVNLDTEASNLTQYQRAYEAAAKLFSIVDTLLAASINLGTLTTVS